MLNQKILLGEEMGQKLEQWQVFFSIVSQPQRGTNNSSKQPTYPAIVRDNNTGLFT